MGMTAEKFLEDYEQEYFAGEVFGEFAYKTEEVEKVMIEFAKYHVKQALIKAFNNARIDKNGQLCIGFGTPGLSVSIDKHSITNAYPLTNIK